MQKKNSPSEKISIEKENRRKEFISKVRELVQQGLSQKNIAEILHTTPKRVRRYSNGDINNLSIHGNKNQRRYSVLDPYSSKIKEMLKQKISYTDIFKHLQANGYTGKYSNLNTYCKRVVEKMNITNGKKDLANQATNTKVAKYISRELFIKHIWSGKEIDENDKNFVFAKYPVLQNIKECVNEFREVFKEKSLELFSDFVDKYTNSKVSTIKSFINGIKQDIKAVENAVTSNLSNGFVEGNNNKLKMIKRMMYGRAKLPLLEAKFLN